jgi:DNA-binding GntR family transcriptional regulator
MTRSSPRAELAYQTLRQAIIEQALRPGAKLPEDQIGSHFGMSRTLVRATLARLHTEGLVDARPKRTVTVARPSLEEARDVFDVRRTLERKVVALVIQRWRPELGAELEGHVREEAAAQARHDDRVSIRLAGEFHIKLAAMAGNRLLERYLGEVVSRCSLILALYGRPHSSECAVNEHSKIISAIRQGDVDAAMELMDAHVGAVEERALIAETAVSGELGPVLSRYAQAIEARDGPLKLQVGRRRRMK